MPGPCSSSLRCHMACVTCSTMPSHHSLSIIYTIIFKCVVFYKPKSCFTDTEVCCEVSACCFGGSLGKVCFVRSALLICGKANSLNHRDVRTYPCRSEYFEIESCISIFLSFLRRQNQFSQQFGYRQESRGGVMHVSVLGSCLHWTRRVSLKIAGNTDHPSRHESNRIRLVKTFLHWRLSLHFQEHLRQILP